MCANRKQSLNALVAIVAIALTGAPALAAGGAASVAVGDGAAGVTDRAWVSAPPHYGYIVEKERGSFLDCGEGQEERKADADGRDMTPLRCGVTLTETITIPAAASSARIIVHF